MANTGGYSQSTPGEEQREMMEILSQETRHSIIMAILGHPYHLTSRTELEEMVSKSTGAIDDAIERLQEEGLIDKYNIENPNNPNQRDYPTAFWGPTVQGIRIFHEYNYLQLVPVQRALYDSSDRTDTMERHLEADRPPLPEAVAEALVFDDEVTVEDEEVREPLFSSQEESETSEIDQMVSGIINADENRSGFETRFPDDPHLDIDYEDGEGETPEDYSRLDAKIEKAIKVTRRGLEQYDNPAVMWTDDKDSTLTLYFIKEVAHQYDLEMPPAVFIDHYQHFDDIHFIEKWADEWDLEVIYARNEDVGEYVEEHGLEPGDDIPIEELNEQNRHHVRDLLEYEEDTFPFLLDTYIGNHLLKTVALNNALEEYDIDGLFSSVRWEEQHRGDETFFSPRHDPDIYPPHDRIHPILQFDEAAVWDAFWYVVVPETVEGYPEEGYVPQSYDDLPEGITQEDIPISPKYFEGFRSLGSEHGLVRSDDRPAWLQDLDNTTERAGRAQDKEDLMERLRDLGYM